MKGKKMTTTATITAPVTSVGQVTLPKVWRDALGIVNSVKIEKKGNAIYIKRAEDYKEKLAKAHALFTPEEQKRIQKYAGMTASEYREKYGNTPEGQKYMEEQYGK